MSEDTSLNLSRFALRFFSGTLLSRISGLLRDMSMAFFFGTSPSLAAFLLAYRFIYLFRRFFGEGLLHQGFIPQFELLKKEEEKRGAIFFRDLFFTLIICISGCILLVESCFFWINSEVIRLAMWMLPGILFLCLFGLSTGLLQSQRSFFLPSVSPVLFNLLWILGIICLKHLQVFQAVQGLALVLSLGFLAQWALTMPKVWKFLRKNLSLKEVLKIRIFSPELKTLIKPLFLGAIGVASVQVNSLIDGIFALYADLEGPAYLWYAIRLQQLPLALFGIALSSALLPSLSRAIQEETMERYFSLIDFAKKRTFILIFPCVIGIFVLGFSSVNLLFGRGDFTDHATYQTTLCLYCYAVGLLPAAFVQILAPGFYAKKDYRTPMVGFFLSSILNIALNGILVFFFHLGAASIALATSISAFVNMFFLHRKLRTPNREIHSRMRIAIFAGIAGLVVVLFGYWFLKDPTLVFFKQREIPIREWTKQVFQFGIEAMLYFSLFFALCFIGKVQEIKDLYSSK